MSTPPNCTTTHAWERLTRPRTIYNLSEPLDPCQCLSVRGRGAAGSASEWHSEGQGFESPRLHYRRVLRRTSENAENGLFSGVSCWGNGGVIRLSLSRKISLFSRLRAKVWAQVFCRPSGDSFLFPRASCV